MNTGTALTAALGLAAAFACAQPQDRPPLPPSVRAALANGPGLSYAGTRIVEFKVGPEVKRHTEFVRRNGDKTRIEFPADSEFAGQVIVEDANRRRHYLPDTNEILVLPARREEAFDRLRAMMDSVRTGQLRVTANPGGPVAGFRTDLVTVSDGAGNLIQRLWVDPRSGMIVKRELYDRVGTRVGFFEFTSVQLAPRFRPNEFQIVVRGAEEVTPRDQLRRLARKSGLPAVLIPPGEGFQLESAQIVQMAGESVLSQTYVGRSGRLSLFTLKNRVDAARIRRLARGDFNVHVWTASDTTFALVGGLPTQALAALARRIGKTPPDVY